MKLKFSILFLFFSIVAAYTQTKVSGYIIDEYNEPVAFANVLFKGSTEGTITNEEGRFYLESDNSWDVLVVSFLGYQMQEIALEKPVTFDMKLVLKEEADALDAVMVVAGKQSKKASENPAIAILQKIWSRKRQNGLRQFEQYQYDKYEKVEFDLNTIDSALIKSRLFKGMEFVFDKVDTSNVTGKTYLPIFINESVSKVYGDTHLNEEKDVVEGNKNSGFSNNQIIIDFVDDLYAEFDIYDNYLKFFDKSFVSPLSRTGVSVYNYVLSDSAFIDNKWCYNIIYYPRRKNELTFKGDFWVNDTTYAIKDINLQASKSANINWVKEIYIEQEFDVINDTLFLIRKDYMLSDFALNKKESSRGVYGKRTTLYDNYKFNIEKDAKFYNAEVFDYQKDVFNRDDDFWEQNRMEKLNKDEVGIYKMLDTLKTVKKFKNLYNIGSILASGYIEVPSINMDIGPVFSVFGYNEVEGVRVRGGGRTYFGPNDLWRLEGFLAYGFKDDKVKHGFSAKWLLDKKIRLIVSGGHRRDVEQIGANLTSSTDVLGRSLASSAVFNTSTNDKLTNVNLFTMALEMEPLKNFIIRASATQRSLESASETFSLDYFDSTSPTGVSSKVDQYESTLSLTYMPGRKMTGFGVERRLANDGFPTLFTQVTRGDKNVFNSDFDFTKVQFSYIQPWQVGGFGRLTTTIELGKTFGQVPLGLLSVVPGNQSYFSIYNTFSQLDFYEFVTDTYGSLHLEHNFNGRIFSRIPFLKKYNLRAIVGARGVIGSISEDNKAINASGLAYVAPDEQLYYEYSFGVGNIFKILRIDFNFRGNYLDAPEARPFGVTGSFGFSF